MSFLTAVYETSGYFKILLSCEFKLAFFKCRKLSNTIFHEIFALCFLVILCVFLGYLSCVLGLVVK